MTLRYLITATVLVTGCEQWKAPQRLHDLEGKVDELTKAVAALDKKPDKAGGGPRPAGRAATIDHAGDHDGSATPPGDGSAAPPERDAPEHAKAKPDEPEHAKAKPDEPERAKAKPDEPEHAKARPDEPERAKAKPDEPERAKARPDEPEHAAGKPEPARDPAMERLLGVVAKGTANKPATATPEAPHWAYDGKHGPPIWGSLDPAWSACTNGKAQSPIDIQPRTGSASPIVFHYAPTAATVVDNGHTLQVNLAPGSSIEIDDHTYQLVQFHFHTPSEHAIAGEHYPLEVHLVHKDSGGRLAVIGVLVDTGAESRTLSGLWAQWPRKVASEAKLRAPFDPSALLPDNRKVFRYTGSLTTPPCTEGVVWNVMRRTLSDSQHHLDAFTRHYQLNAREPQPLNDRRVD